MDKQLDILRKTRKFLLNFISDLTTDQLNEIPAGYNNNIIWNLTHLMASQQGVCYLRSGNKLFIEEKYFANYKPETKPEGPLDAEEIEKIKQLFLAVIDQFETDYRNNLFANYTAWNNRYGVEITNIEDAVTFILFHEGLHLGYIMALKRVVKK